MINWLETKLGKYCDFILGGTPKTKEPAYWNGEIPWVSIVDFDVDKHLEFTEKTITQRGLDESNTKLLEVKDIIISARGTVGKTVVCKRPVAFNQSCYALRSNSKKLDQNFLYYLTNFKVLELKKKAVGGVFDTIVKDTLNDLEITLPQSNVTQLKIASILSNYDNLIENNTRRIQILEEMAQRIYKEWFVDFKYPGHENDKLIDSELGMIPEGWEIKKMGHCIDKVIDNRGKTPPQSDEGYELIEVNALVGKNKIVNFDLIKKYVSEETYNTWFRKGHPKINDILISTVGSIGEICLLDQNRGCIAQNIIALRVKKDIDSHFLYYSMANPRLKNRILSLNQGVAQPSIRVPMMLELNFIYAPYALQEKFKSIVNEMTLLQSSLTLKNNNLRQTRDLLLPKLISGKVDVSDLDIDTSILDD